MSVMVANTIVAHRQRSGQKLVRQHTSQLAYPTPGPFIVGPGGTVQAHLT